MATLEETLRRTIALKVTELPMTPARGFSVLSGEAFDWTKVRQWRCTLTPKKPPTTVKGTKRPTVLTITMLSPEQPTLTKVLECLAADVEAGKLTLWDFGTTFAQGRTDTAAQHMHNTCKKTAPRVQRFFGDTWAKIVRTVGPG
jgi:hypothetical protein